MGKKRKEEVIRIEPLSIKEVCTLTKICGQFDYLKKAIPNLNGGTFSHFKLKSDKPFEKTNVNVIKKFYQMNYNRHLLSEETKEGEFYVCVLSKMSNN